MHLGFDLGAGSGRAVVGRLDDSGLGLEEVHRFQYRPRRASGHLRWDMQAILDGVRVGLTRGAEAAARSGDTLESVGVDSWAVDYGLVDAEGRLLEDPVCYRDERTAGVMDAVFAVVPREEVFDRTGIQHLPLNTLYQLFAHVQEGLPRGATRLLLIPDLCHQFLCGSMVTERTNASTTQLLDPRRGAWDATLFEKLDLPLALMPEVVPAGTSLGTLRSDLQEETGAGPVRVLAPATHDTASAVAGTPLAEGWAYLSSGTWSLLGVERGAPLIDACVARANFTNEAGACDTVRLLKNVMGLWILESCLREWQEEGGVRAHADLLGAVAAVESFPGFVFPDHPRFFNPRHMAAELSAALAESGQSVPDDPVLLAKVVLDSLAGRYASVLEALERITGQPVRGIHVVGGGSRNEYLNQATADATARPVLAGPVEASAAGNVLVQALACGAVPSLADGRERIARGLPPRRFEPRRAAAWAEARRRYREIEGRFVTEAA